jgi:hypothetical protein
VECAKGIFVDLSVAGRIPEWQNGITYAREADLARGRCKRTSSRASTGKRLSQSAAQWVRAFGWRFFFATTCFKWHF